MEMQKLYIADAPIVFLLEVPYPIALSKRVKDFVQIPLGNNIFVDTYLVVLTRRAIACRDAARAS